MKAVTTYLDMRNQPTELTPAELEWFYGLVDLARRATGLSIDIIPYDHELYKGKSKNALGCCCTLDTDDPLGPDADSYITIDCYFIHEKFAELFEGMRTIERQSVIDVIAHEIAHLYCWRHGKKHSRITEEIERKITYQAVADASRKATETSSGTAQSAAPPSPEGKAFGKWRVT